MAAGCWGFGYGFGQDLNYDGGADYGNMLEVDFAGGISDAGGMEGGDAFAGCGGCGGCGGGPANGGGGGGLFGDGGGGGFLVMEMLVVAVVEMEGEEEVGMEVAVEVAEGVVADHKKKCILIN